jgi:signal transduction histidine kinase
MPCSVIAVGLERYDADVEAAVYFACSEALQNAVKHSAASAVRIELCGDRDGVAFSVADDGIGFEPSTAPGASGLQNIEDRVGALGGTAVVESAPGRGTTVSGSIPCRSALRR